MRRITRDELYMFIAHALAKRSTCARRDVGCVIVNERGHVLATGYNGVAAGASHCKGGTPCPGANAESGQALDQCFATHAEQNALLQCSDVWAIDTIYCTAFPCIHCLKLLKNTSCRRIVYAEGYHNPCADLIWDRIAEKADMESMIEVWVGQDAQESILGTVVDDVARVQPAATAGVVADSGPAITSHCTFPNCACNSENACDRSSYW